MGGAEEASFGFLVEGLGDDADIIDAGLAESVDDCGPAAEGNGLIAADVDCLGLRPVRLGEDLSAEVVDIDRLVFEVDALCAVNGHDQADLGELFHGFRFGDVDFDAGLKDGSGDHEDDEEDEDDVDEGHHVDFGKRGAVFAVELRHRRIRLPFDFDA